MLSMALAFIGMAFITNPKAVAVLMGLSGIGDLIVTCASMHSRNRRAGILIGQGKSMEEAMAEVKMVVEGVYSAKAAMQLAKKYNVLRIYHKRITPLLLKASIINFLTEDVEYVTLEMSIYFKDHVRVLSNLLRPTIGCFLQLDSSHLHKDGMDRIEDLAIYKSYIFKYASLGFYNDQDDYIKRISLKDNELYFDNEALFKSKMEELLSFVDNVTIEEDGFKIDGNFVKPYLLTELSMLQYALAYRVGKYVGVDTQDIIDTLNSYVPVENRITKCNIFGKEVFFDGDVTTYERMKQLSKNKYDKSILVIRKFGSAENVDRFEKVVEYFDKLRAEINTKIAEVQLNQLESEIKECLRIMQTSESFPEEVYNRYETLKKEKISLLNNYTIN